MRRLAVGLLALLVGTALGAEPKRLVSVGGAVTETIYALGAEQGLVGVDTSSVFPEAATKLPQCGYQRALSAEGVMSLKPDLLILAGSAGPAAVIEQLQKLEVPIVKLDDEHTLEAAKERIVRIGEALGREEKGREIARRIDEESARIPAAVAAPRVIFIMSRGGGSALVSGAGTAADAMIRLAGAKNAAATFDGYKPVSGEALVTLAPEIILTTSRSFADLGRNGLDKTVPGLAQTPAGKANHVIVMEDLYLLGFGPRVGEALAELSSRIQAMASKPVSARN